MRVRTQSFIFSIRKKIMQLKGLNTRFVCFGMSILTDGVGH